ncbi:MAG TPA: hypothetical protein VJC11_02365 [Patescibacteria group bacterium]|nr:hypothetical protein [Patescibacteria group bacterium]
MKFWIPRIGQRGYEHFQKRFFLWNASISFALIISMAVLIDRFLPEELDLVSLHYNIYTGIDRIGPRAEMWLHPALACLFFLMNLFFAQRYLKKGDVFMNRLVLGFNTGILAALTLATYTIISINR